MLEADNKSLSPLVEFTDALSGEKYVSVLWQPSPKPSGQVARGVDGVYRRYPPAGDRERPLRHSNRHNGEQLRQRARKIRYPLKDCLMFSQGREPGVQAEQSTSRTRYGLSPAATREPARQDDARTIGTASPTGVTSLARDETGPAGKTMPWTLP